MKQSYIQPGFDLQPEDSRVKGEQVVPEGRNVQDTGLVPHTPTVQEDMLELGYDAFVSRACCLSKQATQHVLASRFPTRVHNKTLESNYCLVMSAYFFWEC